MISKFCSNIIKSKFCSQINKRDQIKDKYGRLYPPKAGQYHIPAVTTDSLVVKQMQNGENQILMITRKNNPYKDYLAFPGGFLDYNEDPQEGCLRELKEETGLQGKIETLFDVRGQPCRDPRQHTVSIFYLVSVPSDAEPKAADDAKNAQFYPLHQLLMLNQNVKIYFSEQDWDNQANKTQFPIAFDHLEVLRKLNLYLNSFPQTSN